MNIVFGVGLIIFGVIVFTATFIQFFMPIRNSGDFWIRGGVAALGYFTAVGLFAVGLLLVHGYWR